MNNPLNIYPEAGEALSQADVDPADLIALHRTVTARQKPAGPYGLVRSVHILPTGVRVAVALEQTGQVSIVLAE